MILKVEFSIDPANIQGICLKPGGTEYLLKLILNMHPKSLLNPGKK